MGMVRLGLAIGEHYKMQHNNFLFKADLADSFNISTYNGRMCGKILLTPDVENFYPLIVLRLS
jgi:hypothetical protein